MIGDVRVTAAVARILAIFLEDPDEPRYGFDLMERTSLPSGSLYPILIRLERAGWIIGDREEIDSSAEGRPPRRYFRLTAEGYPAAQQRVSQLHERLTVPPRARTRPNWQGGTA